MGTSKLWVRFNFSRANISFESTSLHKFWFSSGNELKQISIYCNIEPIIILDAYTEAFRFTSPFSLTINNNKNKSTDQIIKVQNKIRNSFAYEKN
jgi:hypothetical protein